MSGLQCGVATTQFAQNPPTLATAVATGKLSFWWDWATGPNVDTNGLSPSTVAAMRSTFVPMLWGQAPVAGYDWITADTKYVMGYNEPDLYGPACCNCDGRQSYYPATSSGHFL